MLMEIFPTEGTVKMEFPLGDFTYWQRALSSVIIKYFMGNRKGAILGLFDEKFSLSCNSQGTYLNYLSIDFIVFRINILMTVIRPNGGGVDIFDACK